LPDRETELDERRLPPPPAAASGPSRVGLVRMGLLFYGAMAAIALLWRGALYREPIFFGSSAAARAGFDWLPDLGLGLAAGLGVVALSYWISERTVWGDRLARAMGEALGFLRVRDAILLALASGIAEELLFRGALQPRVGWLLASLLFGLVHFVPRREFLPWTAFAIAAGLLFGALFDSTGNLLAPITAHFVVNAVNLPMLVRRHGGGPSAS